MVDNIYYINPDLCLRNHPHSFFGHGGVWLTPLFFDGSRRRFSRAHQNWHPAAMKVSLQALETLLQHTAAESISSGGFGFHVSYGSSEVSVQTLVSLFRILRTRIPGRHLPTLDGCFTIIVMFCWCCMTLFVYVIALLLFIPHWYLALRFVPCQWACLGGTFVNLWTWRLMRAPTIAEPSGIGWDASDGDECFPNPLRCLVVKTCVRLLSLSVFLFWLAKDSGSLGRC